MSIPDLNKHIKLSPTQVLVLGFAFFILIGTVLLSLPAATVEGRSLGVVDALFTATSAVCVTGLIVVDTGTQLSLFGQLVVMTLIQAGGLGFMTMATTIFLLLGKRITLKSRLVMQEALNQFTMEGVVRVTRNIILVTLLIEAAGAIILSARFVPMFGLARGLYYGIFHSISAFCNAGFDLIGYYRSLTGFIADPVINFTIMALIVIGGIGFAVILDICSRTEIRKWSLHTRVVLLATGMLLAAGFLFFLIIEYNNPETLGLQPLPAKILGAMFQSVTFRTAGFNTIDPAAMTDASKFFAVILMLVGASPASTGGGIKTTTVTMVLLMTISVIRGREENDIFGRRIPPALTNRALAITLIYLMVFMAVSIILSFLESVPFIDIMFQTASALGTVGVTSMDTGGMHVISKLVLSLVMFMGRVGPLTLTLALARRQARGSNSIKYPEDKVMIG